MKSEDFMDSLTINLFAGMTEAQSSPQDRTTMNKFFMLTPFRFWQLTRFDPSCNPSPQHPSKSTVNGSYPPHSYSKESELHQKNYLIENMKTVQESTMCHKF